jgi:hypothetical protein
MRTSGRRDDVDDLLAKAGVKREDFNGLRSVTESEFSGRIIVEVGNALSGQPIDRREPVNLHAIYHDIGTSRYIFNPVE